MTRGASPTFPSFVMQRVQPDRVDAFRSEGCAKQSQPDRATLTFLAFPDHAALRDYSGQRDPTGWAGKIFHQFEAHLSSDACPEQARRISLLATSIDLLTSRFDELDRETSPSCARADLHFLDRPYSFDADVSERPFFLRSCAGRAKFLRHAQPRRAQDRDALRFRFSRYR